MVMYITVYADHSEIWNGKVYRGPARPYQIWPRSGMGGYRSPIIESFVKYNGFCQFLRVSLHFPSLPFPSSVPRFPFLSFPAISHPSTSFPFLFRPLFLQQWSYMHVVRTAVTLRYKFLHCPHQLVSWSLKSLFSTNSYITDNLVPTRCILLASVCTSGRTFRCQCLYLRADVQVPVFVPQGGRSGASVCTSERTFRCQCLYLRADAQVPVYVPQRGR